MNVSSTLSADGAELTIRISGSFSNSGCALFRESYENNGSAVSRYRLDMSDAAHLDSSALGMLLVLRDYAGGDASDIVIESCSAEIERILTISNFKSLFSFPGLELQGEV